MKCGKCGHDTSRSGLNRYWDSRKGWCHQICRKRRGRKKAVRVRIKNVDVSATWSRNFKDPRSVVYLDRRERLYGLDYKRRVREVEERDGYRCQWPVTMTGVDASVCGAPSNGHPHHRVKRSKGRDDRASNLMAICDAHHKIAHPEKQVRWTKGESK